MIKQKQILEENLKTMLACKLNIDKTLTELGISLDYDLVTLYGIVQDERTFYDLVRQKQREK